MAELVAERTKRRANLAATYHSPRPYRSSEATLESETIHKIRTLVDFLHDPESDQSWHVQWDNGRFGNGSHSLQGAQKLHKTRESIEGDKTKI